MATTPTQPTQPQGFAAVPSSQASTCPPGHIRMSGRCVQAQTSQRPTDGSMPGVPPAPTATGERVQRHGAAGRSMIGENRRQRAAGARFATSFAEMGLRPAKEQGQAFLKRAELHAEQGPFADFLANWDVTWKNGEPWLRPLPNQVGRQAEWGGDPTQYKPASQVLSPGHWAAFQRTRAGSAKGNARQAFIEGNNLQGTPGGGMDAWIHQRYLQGLKPAPGQPGMVVNRYGDTYAANNRILQGLRTAGAGSLSPAAPAPGARPPQTGGGYQAPGSAPPTATPPASTPPPSTPGAPGTPPGAAPPPPSSGDPLQDEITNYLRDMLGSGGPFGEGETAAARSALRSTTEGGAQRAREEAQFDAIRTGMARSQAGLGRNLANIRRGAEQDYSRGSTQIRLEHAEKNFGARMQALSGMANQLQSARQYAIAQAQTELERQRIAQNYDIALRNIAMARDQLAQQMSQFTQSLDLQRDQFDWTREQGSCPVQQADGTVVTVPIPCSQLAGGFM